MKRHARIIAIAALFAAVVACSGIASAQYINGTTLPPATGPTPDETCLPMGSAIGLRWSYCDVASALFSYNQVDMTLPGPMPIVLRGIYRSEAYNDNGAAVPYPFGPGTNFDYNMFLWSEYENSGQQGLLNVDLILPDGGASLLRLHWQQLYATQWLGIQVYRDAQPDFLFRDHSVCRQPPKLAAYHQGWHQVHLPV